MLTLANPSAVRTGAVTRLAVASCWELGPHPKIDIAVTMTSNNAVVLAVGGSRRREYLCPSDGAEQPDEFQPVHAEWMAWRRNV